MVITKIKEEDLDICVQGISDLLATSNIEMEAGDSISMLASRMRFLILFLERFAKENYREIVRQPIPTTGKLVKKETRTWQQECLIFLPNFLKLCDTLPEEYEYSVMFEVFKATYRDHSLDLHDPFFREFCRNPDRFYFLFAYEHFRIRLAINNFMLDLHRKLRDPKIRRKELERRRNADRNYKEAIIYSDEIQDSKAKVIVVRLDFFYKKGIMASIVDLAKDMKRFYNNMRHNKLFKHFLGGMKKFEYGAKKGPHAHLLLFFDASENDPRRDIHLAKEIGEYWLSIAGQERGDYWNCNANKQTFEDNNLLGIGAIHYSDKVKIANLHRIIRYFCKVEQFIKCKIKSKMKMFCRGKHLKRSGNKRGAPRQKTQCFVV